MWSELKYRMQQFKDNFSQNRFQDAVYGSWYQDPDRSNPIVCQRFSSGYEYME